MKLNIQGMQILMGELQQNEIWAIHLMSHGKEMTDNVTKVDLSRIISVLCKILNWIEGDDDSKHDLKTTQNEKESELGVEEDSNLETTNSEDNNRAVEKVTSVDIIPPKKACNVLERNFPDPSPTSDSKQLDTNMLEGTIKAPNNIGSNTLLDI